MEFTKTLIDADVAMIGKQPVFFMATAAADARINLNPKGYNAFRVLSPSQVAYLDQDRTNSIDGLSVRVQTSMPCDEQS